MICKKNTIHRQDVNLCNKTCSKFSCYLHCANMLSWFPPQKRWIFQNASKTTILTTTNSWAQSKRPCEAIAEVEAESNPAGIHSPRFFLFPIQARRHRKQKQTAKSGMYHGHLQINDRLHTGANLACLLLEFTSDMPKAIQRVPNVVAM